jgi:thiamine-monophosphate kinase
MGSRPVTELGLVSWVRRRVPPPGSTVVGIGDDAAVVPTREKTVVTTDMLLDRVHFRSDRDAPADIGWKAMACNLSDIAAMGAKPRFAVAAIGLPAGYPAAAARALVRGLVRAADRFSVDLVGGDTNSSPLGMVVAVTVLGDLLDAPVRRSGARIGDAVCVTGTLGGSILGRHLRFVPRVREAAYLVQRYAPHAMIDVSDGLLLDAWRLCRESGVGILLDEERIPVSAAAGRLARRTGKTALEHALSDGEDFELLFTLAPGQATRLERDRRLRGLVTRIGEVVRRGLHLRQRDGRTTSVRPMGYEHFRVD